MRRDPRDPAPAAARAVQPVDHRESSPGLARVGLGRVEMVADLGLGRGALEKMPLNPRRLRLGRDPDGRAQPRGTGRRLRLQAGRDERYD